MTGTNRGIPWPVWAAVMLGVALIGAYVTLNTQGQSGSSSGAGTAPPPKPAANDIAGEYLMDNNPQRLIVVTLISGGKYRIEEPSGPWPWVGTAELDGGSLRGSATFPKSSATMDVEGVVRGDGSIQIEYKFVTKGDGSPAGGQVDSHVWYPR